MPIQTLHLLLDRSDFEDLKLVPKLLPDERLNIFIHEAQQFDLRLLMGDAFYYDMIKNKNEDKYKLLLQGEEYEDFDENTIIFQGLRMCLIYFTYARLLLGNFKHAGTHTYEIKKNPYSENVDTKIIMADATSAKSGAMQYWDETTKYLNKKEDTFPLWKNSCVSTSKMSSIRISKI